MNDAAKTAEGKPWLMRVGIGVFAVGVLGVLAVFVMFAAGMHDLPVWLSLVAGVLTPLGMVLGFIALVQEHRKR
ncbi:hypothetical protein [Amycolatopsis alkalitolerans]|uniref:Uncharacterized protein n=1 Tax=Amycolatopsis alkalitolerans TaxID=2547244 RepID=A0A5C4M4W6_9PSEU|nr:hypothetical protein [Amycolatopsis alkalitolerans]TNC28148.1 hypothetical protein FG385_06905 [Amycolatopsis alkalitolerans]